MQRSSSRLRITIAIGVVLSFAACVYIPTPEHEDPIIAGSARGRVPMDTSNAFILGKSTRTDVLLALGNPSSREGSDRYLTYSWSAIQGYAFLLLPGAPSAEVRNIHDLVFEFNNDGRLKRFKAFEDGISFERKKEILKWKSDQNNGTPSQ